MKTKYGNDAYNDIAFALSKDDVSDHAYLLDKPIKSLSTCNLADVMLLVVCPEHEYMQLAARLRSKGMKEFTDFKWYKFYDKKVCLINANCHGPLLKLGLLMHPAFTEEYTIHPHMALAGYMPQGMHTPLEDDLLANVDCVLMQHMQPENSMSPSYSDENVSKKISSNAKVIFIPNFYAWGTGIYQTQTLNILKGWDGSDAFYEDTLLNLAYEQAWRKDIKTILQFIENYEMNSATIHEKFEQMIEHLKKREKTWNIKIIDWMASNYKRVPIYNDLGHPAAIVMWWVCKAVLYLLGIPSDDTLQEVYEREYYMGLGGLIPPCVAETLGIEYARTVPIKRVNHEFMKENLRMKEQRDICYFSMDRVQYLQDYYFVRYGEILPYEKTFSRRVTKEDMIEAYRLFLGRLPGESESSFENLRNLRDVEELRKIFVQTQEFQQFYESVNNQ